MRFGTSLSSVFVGALFATSALGEALQVPRRAAENLVAREDAANAIRSMTTEEKIRKRADECLDHISARRRLKARVYKPVNIGEYDVGTGDDEIETTGLASCFGVAITGTWAEGTSGEFDRGLSHTYPDSATSPGVEESFIYLMEEFQEVIGQGLHIDRVVMVAADPAAYTEDRGWTEEDIEAYKTEYAGYVAAITQYIGTSPEEKKHDYTDVWKLKINSDKRIECRDGSNNDKCA
ncbi:hypothetical protein F5Y18DRAFT_418020 [Xylariaceae sp. FL1019]|nr:hypothetical protein F5Y18DRAFT_418020 [Xylariaceae sp. FL1019]